MWFLELVLTLMIGAIIGATQERVMSLFARVLALETGLAMLIAARTEPAVTDTETVTAEAFNALSGAHDALLARIETLESVIGASTDGENKTANAESASSSADSTTPAPTPETPAAGAAPASSESIDPGSSQTASAAAS